MKAGSGPPPGVGCRAAGPCAVAHLPPLSDPEVQGYLKSGLTSTLVITLSTRDATGARRSAAARIDVRFEPWDEVFHIRVVPAAGRAPEPRTASATEFAAWWQALELSFPLTSAPRANAHVELTVVPFSEDEEADARRWYAEAVRGGGGASRGASGLGEALDTLTLTSIKRRGVLTFSWSVPVEPQR